MATFTTEQLIQAIDLLVEDLRKQNETVRIRIVGGAAVALQYDDRRTATRDIDALDAHPEDVVMRSVERLADLHGWPADWLNTKVRMFNLTQITRNRPGVSSATLTRSSSRLEDPSCSLQ